MWSPRSPDRLVPPSDLPGGYDHVLARRRAHNNRLAYKIIAGALAASVVVAAAVFNHDKEPVGTKEDKKFAGSVFNGKPALAETYVVVLTATEDDAPIRARSTPDSAENLNSDSTQSNYAGRFPRASFALVQPISRNNMYLFQSEKGARSPAELAHDFDWISQKITNQRRSNNQEYGTLFCPEDDPDYGYERQRAYYDVDTSAFTNEQGEPVGTYIWGDSRADVVEQVEAMGYSQANC